MSKDLGTPASTSTTASGETPQPVIVNGMTVDERFDIIRGVGEECISDQELRNLLEKKPEIRCYDGFEPSGRLHIAQGLFKAVNVNKCTKVGCTFTFWVADWFALMNNKMGGDLDKIRTVGAYLVEVWKAAGMDMSKVEFRWCADDITNHAEEYWKRTLDIGRRNSLARLKKCCQIMGRSEGSLRSAMILYPLMQCCDIFFLKADICQLGVDQRKVNMLAREYCDQIKKKLKPVILSHHMLSGLLEGMGKMSKSNPDSAIFMEDTPEDVARKINQAYCPSVKQEKREIDEDGAITADSNVNPVLDYLQNIVFSHAGIVVEVEGKEFDTYKALEEAFLTGLVSESALKATLIREINRLLDPIRAHFRENENAKGLLEKIRSWQTQGVAESKEVKKEVPITSHAIAYVPCSFKVQLNVAASLASSFEKAEKGTLILPDWSAFSRNDLNGDEKGIAAVLDYNAALLKTVLPEKVSVIRQSELILKDVSKYWVTAISAGRVLDCAQFEKAITINCAGTVVASLMTIADTVLLEGTQLLDNGSEEDLNDVVVAHLGEGYSRVSLGSFFPPLCDPKTLEDGGASVLSTLDDKNFLNLNDSDKDLSGKIKKAFLSPDTPKSPVIDIACTLVGTGKQIGIKQQGATEETVYTDGEKLVSDYSAGLLHPGDLKAAATKAVLEATAVTRKKLTSPDVTKLATGVKNAEKKVAKK